MFRLICVVLLALGYYEYVYEPQREEIKQPPGVLVRTTISEEPVQIAPWKKGDYTITALEAFAIVARVLSKSHYWLDKESNLSSYDLALGWQQMSDSSVLDQLDISQSGRWYYYTWHNTAPIAEGQIPVESGNMHIIAGNDEILAGLGKIKKGNIIGLEGYLVQARAPDGWTWTSGLSSESSGPHGCKLIWVTKLVIL